MQWNVESQSLKYYIAGILDGEVTSTNYGNYLVGVAMTDKKLIRWLQQKLGGTFQLRKEGWEKWMEQTGVCVEDQRYETGEVFLSVMLPYLRIKNVKAKQVIKEIDKIFMKK